MKKILFFVASIASICIILVTLRNTIFNKSKIDNFKLGNIVQQINFPKSINKDNLFAGQQVDLVFDSCFNNLGIIEILFNNYSKVNSDKLFFRIRESGKERWDYEAIYDTSIMDGGQYFPFGFPVINNSKGKSYDIQLQSLSGKNGDHVSISDNTKLFKAKYLYDKSFLIHNPKYIMMFIFNKTAEIQNYIELNDLLIAGLLSSLPFLILFELTFLYIRLSKFKKLKFIFDTPLIVVVSAYIISHIKFLDYRQYWDSNWYFQLLISGVESVKAIPIYNILDHIRNFVINFNFLGHSSMFYTGYLGIGQLISFNNVYILNIQNMLLGILGLVGFYKILNHLFPNNKHENILVTSIFAFNPLYFATTIALNTDMPTLVFGILLALAFLNENKLSFIVCSLALIFSKETGILIYLSMVFSYILIYEFKRKRKISSYFGKVAFYLIPFSLFAIYLIATGGNLHSYDSVSNTGNSYKFKWDDNGFFTFGFNSKNILLRFFQIFIMNFGWVGFVFLTIAAFMSVIYDKDILSNYPSEIRDKIRFVLYSYAPFIILIFLFLTMDFSRYVVPVTFITTLILYLSLKFLLKKDNYRMASLSIILVLIVIQVYKPIDPSAKLIFGESIIGKNTSSTVFGYRDGLVYNTQFYFVDQLSRLIEKEIGQYPVVIDASAEYYFKEIKYMSTVKDEKYLKENKILYIYVPWFEDTNEGIDKLLIKYNVKSEKYVDYKGYYVKLYFLERK